MEQNMQKMTDFQKVWQSFEFYWNPAKVLDYDIFRSIPLSLETIRINKN